MPSPPSGGEFFFFLSPDSRKTPPLRDPDLTSLAVTQFGDDGARGVEAVAHGV